MNSRNWSGLTFVPSTMQSPTPPLILASYQARALSPIMPLSATMLTMGA